MKLFFILAALIFIVPTGAHAQCSTPTCITFDIIGTAKNIVVDNANAEPQMAMVAGPEEDADLDCNASPMIKSGATVYRWYAPGKDAEYRQYDDQFCLTQGCSHQGGLSGSSRCASAP